MWPCLKHRCILKSTLFWALVKSAQGIPRWVPLLNQHHRGLDLPVSWQLVSMCPILTRSSPDLHEEILIFEKPCQIPLRQIGSLFFPIQNRFRPHPIRRVILVLQHLGNHNMVKDDTRIFQPRGIILVPFKTYTTTHLYTCPPIFLYHISYT